MTRSNRYIFLLSLCLIAWTSNLQADDTEPLIFGVFPYVTAKQIVETYRPIAYSLEKRLKRRVLLYTARDFKTFTERTRQGEYDLVLTAPHLALLAMQDANYRPIIQHAHPIRGFLVVRSDSHFDSPEALRGHTIAMANPFALVVLAVQADLALQGIKNNIDYHSINAVTHINAAMQVINERAEAAILAGQPYAMMRPALRQQLRTVHETQALPGLVYLTHPRLSSQESDAIRKALLAFSSSPKGKLFLKRGNHGSLTPVAHESLLTLEPYVLQTRERLRPTQ